MACPALLEYKHHETVFSMKGQNLGMNCDSATMSEPD